jgi:uncharacterized protein (DUF2147 family)
MRKWFLVIAALLAHVAEAAAAQGAILGSWLTEAGDSNANNSDASLRARPILGLEVLSGFKVGSAGAWTGGTMYSPRKGKSYPATLSLAPDGRLQIEVKAGFVSRNVYWTR